MCKSYKIINQLMSNQIPPEFWQGVEQFNQQDFYACHDTLEALWMEAREPEKKFYQGVLQIAVSLYHLSNHNWQGAAILLGEGMNRLRNYQPIYFEIDVEHLIQDSVRMLNTLQQFGPENVAALADELFKNDPSDLSGGNDNLDVPLELPKIHKVS
jgi:predicted metal-dependent hydrolase